MTLLASTSPTSRQDGGRHLPGVVARRNSDRVCFVQRHLYLGCGRRRRSRATRHQRWRSQTHARVGAWISTTASSPVARTWAEPSNACMTESQTALQATVSERDGEGLARYLLSFRWPYRNAEVHKNPGGWRPAVVAANPAIRAEPFGARQGAGTGQPAVPHHAAASALSQL